MSSDTPKEGESGEHGSSYAASLPQINQMSNKISPAVFSEDEDGGKDQVDSLRNLDQKSVADKKMTLRQFLENREKNLRTIKEAQSAYKAYKLSSMAHNMGDRNLRKEVEEEKTDKAKKLVAKFRKEKKV